MRRIEFTKVPEFGRTRPSVQASEEGSSQYGVRATQADSLSDPFTVGERGAGTRHHDEWNHLLGENFVSYLMFIKASKPSMTFIVSGGLI